MKLLLFLLSLIYSTLSYSFTLIIGSSRYNPPFETWTSHNQVYYGYDVDLMMEICRRMNATCEFVPYPFDQLFNVLKNNKVDLVISSIIVTDERKKDFLFSLPYLESNAQYLVNSDSAIHTVVDLYGKKVGVKGGTPYGARVLTSNQNNTVVRYHNLEDMFIALQNNEVNAVLIDYESAKYWVAINPGIYRYVGGKTSIGQGYAIMANKNRTELIEAINRIILEMESDGTFLKIYSQYF